MIRPCLLMPRRMSQRTQLNLAQRPHPLSLPSARRRASTLARTCPRTPPRTRRRRCTTPRSDRCSGTRMKSAKRRDGCRHQEWSSRSRSNPSRKCTRRWHHRTRRGRRSREGSGATRTRGQPSRRRTSSCPRSRRRGPSNCERTPRRCSRRLQSHVRTHTSRADPDPCRPCTGHGPSMACHRAAMGLGTGRRWRNRCRGSPHYTSTGPCHRRPRRTCHCASSRSGTHTGSSRCRHASRCTGTCPRSRCRRRCTQPRIPRQPAARNRPLPSPHRMCRRLRGTGRAGSSCSGRT